LQNCVPYVFMNNRPVPIHHLYMQHEAAMPTYQQTAY
jgi:hypothetical protein